MAIRMEQYFEGGSEVGRISSLPRNVMGRILLFLPVRDAARTCVLSSEWRYLWADQPALFLHGCFWHDVLENCKNPYMNFGKIVNSILLYHVGHINQFMLDFSLMCFTQLSDIDLWLSSLCRRSLKILTLKNSNPINRYVVPSWIFSSSKLIELRITNCIIKTSGSIGCFSTIEILSLKNLSLDSTVLTIPLLTHLRIRKCYGACGFNIIAPRLVSLDLQDNDYLNLKPYLKCRGIKEATFYSSGKIEHPHYFESEDCRSVNLVHLFAAWPMISDIDMDESSFKYLAKGRVPNILELKLTIFTLYQINLDSELLAWILCILKSSPLLQTFEIWFAVTDLEDVNQIDEPSIMDIKMEQLHTVKMKYFTTSGVRNMFANIILQCAPVLRKLLVEENDDLDLSERLKISKKLFLLQQAFPKTEIIFRPDLLRPG